MVLDLATRVTSRFSKKFRRRNRGVDTQDLYRSSLEWPTAKQSFLCE